MLVDQGVTKGQGQAIRTDCCDDMNLVFILTVPMRCAWDDNLVIDLQHNVITIVPPTPLAATWQPLQED